MLKKIVLLILLLTIYVYGQNSFIHHEITAQITPSKSFIEVADEITIPEELLKDNLTFKLNAKLKLKPIPEKNIKIYNREINGNDIGMDRDDAGLTKSLKLKEYIILGFDKNKPLKLNFEYSGKIKSPLKQSEENYQRGFSESPGIIDSIGIYLAGSTYWVPTFGDELVSFNLTTTLPEKWETVSQGKRTLNKIKNKTHIDTWNSPTPQEEIFLIAAKFNEYKYSMGSVDAMAFLRTPDEALANKYLETTAQYMEMYRNLIGPFPYPKFALVENFWETGYGMPSFTLLGEKIIRFPFILHSSYPHELLHNWWGNSVYVDFTKGNWCEGITAYMADHLIKEQRGQGENYRRSTIQKFTDFVNKENDFPLNKFISRHNASSEAIGYGKTLMMFHMLRRRVVDNNFKKSFQVFYRDNKFKRATFDDIRLAFENTTGQKLKWFFNQWVNRTGAPKLTLQDVTTQKLETTYITKITLAQTQKDKPFSLDVPIAIVTENGTDIKVFHLSERKDNFLFTTKGKPYKVSVDPQFDVFRILDANEIPLAFTKAYGSKKTLMILPSTKDKYFNSYKSFANSWTKGKEENFIIKTEKEIKTLPTDTTVWVMGYDNKFAVTVNNQIKKYNSNILADTVKLLKKKITKNNNSFFITVKNPNNTNEAIIFLSIGNKKAVSGLVRKLPHYGKYSYLAFEGSEPSNISKGQWQVTNSPLVKILDDRGKTTPIKTEKRIPLASLAPVFSSKRMKEHIDYLASKKMKGRGINTPEIEKAANYILEKFKEYGLKPGADNGTYIQEFEHQFNDKGKLKLKNIIGIIPGTNPNLNEAVVVSAHYDHLGYGWPDVRKGNEGKIHYGADDNASGVAVMLELAKTLGKKLKPSRTIIFVAFSGEEAGLLGSKFFVDNYKKFKILADLNLDTVGRLFGKKIMILNANSAREWKFIFMGTEYTTGIGSDIITQQLDASDQVSFIQKGIPAVQFFSGPNEDYHRPSDTPDKIDADGLVKVSTVVREVLIYLAERDKPLEFKGKLKSDINKNKSEIKKAKSNTRRVSTGTMPDFTYNGKGVKVAAVSKTSPAEKAGLKKGDIIIRFDKKEVKTLRDYSDYLKEHKPGDTIELTIKRKGKTKKIKLVLAER